MGTTTNQNRALQREQNQLRAACPCLAVSYLMHLKSLGITTIESFNAASPDWLAQSGLDEKSQQIIRTHIEGV
ncbi:MAG TPA: hypothetical protein VGJ84_21880 [Polyangiaceae bacterium]